MYWHPRLSESIDYSELTGLTPRAWLVVESGINREEVKAILLSAGISFVGEAVLDLPGFCVKMFGGFISARDLLTASARQEVLRSILQKTARAGESWPELARLRRQKGFFKKLDQSLQSLRQTYSTEDERLAAAELLAAFPTPIRDEIRRLVVHYEAWLTTQKKWDLPRLLLAASGMLSQTEIPLRLPEKIYLLSGAPSESRTESFFEELGLRVETARVKLVEEPADPERAPRAQIAWEAHQTLDDAAARLADELALSLRKNGTLAEEGVLIPDEPSVRRSLSRALRRAGILLQDPRDPTVLRLSEELKSALLSARLVALDYPVALLIEAAQLVYSGDYKKRQELVDRIHHEGWYQGFPPFVAADFPEFQEFLVRVREAFSGRNVLAEYKKAHLDCLEREGAAHWVRTFLERIYDSYAADLALVGESGQVRPFRSFLERIQERINEATPPVEKVAYPAGLPLYRLGTVPLRYPKRLWCFGIPARFTQTQEVGDYALSSRDRERLSGSFQIKTARETNRFRKLALKQALDYSDEVIFLDAEYGPDGREREGIGALLAELGAASVQREIRGAHPRFVRSFLAPKSAPPRDIQLPALSREHSIRTSAMEAYSRCPFQALVRYRLRLDEAEVADLEPAPNWKGTLLHKAVHLLIDSRDPHSGAFRISAADALAQAEASHPMENVFSSSRLRRGYHRRLMRILDQFVEKETKWWNIARTRVFSLEGPELTTTVDGYTIKGRPDRIDERSDGFLIIDYKTGSDSPQGSDVVELGYRLQMPIYARALRTMTDREVLGYSYVELTNDGSRAKGLYFARDHGKHEGALNHSPRKTKSILQSEPADAWNRLDDWIEKRVRDYVSGQFRVEPVLAKECDKCFARDACGQRRFLETDDEGSDGDE